MQSVPVALDMLLFGLFIFGGLVGGVIGFVFARIERSETRYGPPSEPLWTSSTKTRTTTTTTPTADGSLPGEPDPRRWTR